MPCPYGEVPAKGRLFCVGGLCGGRGWRGRRVELWRAFFGTQSEPALEARCY